MPHVLDDVQLQPGIFSGLRGRRLLRLVRPNAFIMLAYHQWYIELGQVDKLIKLIQPFDELDLFRKLGRSKSPHKR